LEGRFCQGIVSDRSSGQSDASSALSDLSPVLAHNNASDELFGVAAIP
jgi:hypothetical protein